MGNSAKSAQFLIDSRLAEAAAGDGDALYDLGIRYSTGTAGAPIDLIEAHKFFNLAAISGLESAKSYRADIAEDMTAREIATAQAAARSWLASTQRRAA